MSRKEEQDNVYYLDQPIPDWMIFWRRMLQLAHHPTPEKFTPFALNYLLVSTMSADLPRNPLFEFDPRDYHRFRFKSQTTFVQTMLRDLDYEPTAAVVNDSAHAWNILKLDEFFKKDRSQLRVELAHQGEIPNFSMLSKFWTSKKPSVNVLEALDISLKLFRQIPVCLHTPIRNIKELLEDNSFEIFLSQKKPTPNYLSIFPEAVRKLIIGLENVDDAQALSLIRHYAEEATKHADSPVEYMKYIYLIFEEIKALLADAPYCLNDFRTAFGKIFPGATMHYSQSGSNALSTIIYALYQQKNAQLTVLNVGSKYYEEPIALQHTGHTIIAANLNDLDTSLQRLVEDGKKVDLLRIDNKAPANCQRQYEKFDIIEIVDKLEKLKVCGEYFTLVIDGTLNELFDNEINLLKENLNPNINFVYFGSGVKSHCMGVDIATFGWIEVYNQKNRFETFNNYLQACSLHNSTNNPDFQFVTHLYMHCADIIQLYQEQLFKQTDKIYQALNTHCDIADRSNNRVPYIEIFDQTEVKVLKERLQNTMLRYRGSFGFPYPTWLEIHSGKETAIRVAPGILTEDQTTELISILTSALTIKPSLKMC